MLDFFVVVSSIVACAFQLAFAIGQYFLLRSAWPVGSCQGRRGSFHPRIARAVGIKGKRHGTCVEVDFLRIDEESWFVAVCSVACIILCFKLQYDVNCSGS